MKTKVLIIAWLWSFGFKTGGEKAADQELVVADSAVLENETNQKKTRNPYLAAFLENPIDLKDFKHKKGRKVNTSVSNGKAYYYNPQNHDSIYYGYSFWQENIDPRHINEVVVFKYGANKHRYEDETETLIACKIYNEDPDLGKANLIGCTKKEIEAMFGAEYQKYDYRMVYAYKNKVLIVKLDKSQATFLHYVKLNTNKINSTLLNALLK